jgi:hypothetical protein
MKVNKFVIVHSFFCGMNNSFKHLTMFMIVYFTGVSSLSDAEHREAQRRGDANIEQTASLPPFIVHWITRLDQSEKEREESHQGAHIRFVDVIERFFAKLGAEETKYRARMDELEVRLLHLSIVRKETSRMSLIVLMIYWSSSIWSLS